MKNFNMKNKITFILLSLFLLNPTLGYSYQGEVFTLSSLAPIEQKSAQAIWQITIPTSILVTAGGTGFFISKNEFVTNFHVASHLTQDNINNSYLIQEGNLRALRIKKTKHLSAQHDLAILEIEGEVNDYLNISKETPKLDKNLFLIGYPVKKFAVIKNTSDMLYYDESNYAFFSDHSVLPGASGSPLLNLKGEVVGVLYSARANLAYATKAINLKSLLNKEIKSFETPEGHIAYAIEQLEKAANQGLAEAQYNLGISYGKGEGVEQDHNKTLDWIEKAANQGLAIAQFHLGFFYDKTSGVEQDHNQAFNWYQKAANQGLAIAQFNLAVFYYYGKGVEPDLNQAFNWFEKSANQGHAIAQFNLSALYYLGTGVEKDLNQAFNWIEKAANQGHAKAQFELGLSYYQGEGVEKDLNQAFNWFKKAANQGLAEAIAQLEYLTLGM